MPNLPGASLDSPYVGLVPYTEEDARFFFGRERDQRVVVANLFASRLTLLYGASGVGKSSLLRAGVMKDLRQRIADAREAGDAPDLAIIYFNEWQGQPLQRLSAVIRESLATRVDPAALEHALARPRLSERIADLVGHMKADLFVIFDQFEEYFLYRGSDTESNSFETEFARLANDETLPISFLLSLRDDALSKLDRFRTLIPNLFASLVRVRHLTADEARAAIVKPIEAYNALPEDRRTLHGTFAIEPGLVDAVIESVRTGRVLIGDVGRGQVAAGAPPSGVEAPFLQLVMTALWRHETAVGSQTLRVKSLTDLGGAAEIVRGHLRTVMDALNSGEQSICANLFQFLVTPTGSKIAHGADDLAGFAKRPAREIELVLAKLSGSRTRILSPVAPPNEQPGPIRYEIYHDSLAQAILEWRRRYVADEERTATARRNEEAAARQREQLAQAQAIADAQRARAEAETERVRIQQRSSRRLAVLSVVLAVLMVVAVGAAVYAVMQSREATRQAERAAAAELDKSRVQQDSAAKLADLQAQLDRLSAVAAVSDQQRQELQRISAVVAQQSQALQQSSRLSEQGAVAKKQLDEAVSRVNTLQTQLKTVTAERDALRYREQMQAPSKK